MKLSIATRIFVGYAVVLATFGAVSLFSVAEMHQNQLEIRLVSQGYLPLSQHAAAIETFHKNQEKDTERLMEERSVETRRALIRLARLYFPPLMAQRIKAGRERAQAAAELAPKAEGRFVREAEEKFADLERRYKAYEQASDRVFAQLEVPQVDPARLAQPMTELKRLEASIGRDIRVLHQTIEARIRERVDQAEKRERRTGVAILALSVLAIAVGLLATAVAARALRPVRTLIEGVSRIGRGDYSAQLGIQGDDEVAVLAGEFDQMARSLQDREAQLRAQQQALLRAEQLAAVGRISAQVAHEVRNPLSSIGLNVELLQDALGKARFERPEEAGEAQEIIGAVTREVDRITEITEEYLRMAKPPQPQLQAEDLNQVLGNVLDFSREELDRAKVTVVRRLAQQAPRALADEAQLRQVFLNLLRNSREAMSAGGQLVVESRVENGAVEVLFSDSGRGIAAGDRERIFDPFFSTKERGTGLGLAVARQILQAHGGSIDCESAPGQGTTFRIRLPRT
jgi:two-component system, NtrC family, sensor kinase